MPLTLQQDRRSRLGLVRRLRGPAAALAVVVLVLVTASASLARARFAYRDVEKVGTQLYPSAVEVADFNRDGKPDLVIADRLGSGVNVLLGQGRGHFQSDGSELETQPFGHPYAVAVGDINGDAMPDIVATDQNGRSVVILIGEGNGSFLAAVKEYVGWMPSGVVVADFDHDGHADIATADQGSDQVSILDGTGCGWSNSPDTCASTPAFQPVESFAVPAGSEPEGIAAGDLDGDTFPDLAVAEHGDRAISLLHNNGGAGPQAFDPPARVRVGKQSKPRWVGIVDLDRDGHRDVVTTGNGGGIRVILDAGQFSTSVKVARVGHGANYGLAIGRLDKGKWPDVVVGDRDGELEIYRGTGTSSLLAPAAFTRGLNAPSPYAAAVANLDNHGRPDLIATEPYGRQLEVYLAM